MPDVSAQVEIPKRALFKAAEVCDLAKVQPYVLRSWEAEFPELGVAKTRGRAARLPPRRRRAGAADQASAARRRADAGRRAAASRGAEGAPVAADEPVLDELIGQNARERLTAVKRGLQSILELLAGAHGADEFRLAAPRSGAIACTIDAGGAGQAVARQDDGVAERIGETPGARPQARRKRSA